MLFSDYLHKVLSETNEAKGYLDTCLDIFADDRDEKMLWISIQSIVEAQKPKSAKWQQSACYALNAEEAKLLAKLRPYVWETCTNIAEFKIMAEEVVEHKNLLEDLRSGRARILFDVPLENDEHGRIMTQAAKNFIKRASVTKQLYDGCKEILDVQGVLPDEFERAKKLGL
jgi:hypothetical protein